MGKTGGGLVARMRKENNNSKDWLIDDHIRIAYMCPRYGLQMTPVALALEATNMYQWDLDMFVIWLFIYSCFEDTPRTFLYEMGILCHYKMLLPDPIL